MENWSEQQEVRKEVKEKDKVRREKLASLFFDLCKVTYNCAGRRIAGYIIPE